MILEDSFFLALIPPNSAAIRNVKENKIDDNLLPKPVGNCVQINEESIYTYVPSSWYFFYISSCSFIIVVPNYLEVIFFLILDQYTNYFGSSSIVFLTHCCAF